MFFSENPPKHHFVLRKYESPDKSIVGITESSDLSPLNVQSNDSTCRNFGVGAFSLGKLATLSIRSYYCYVEFRIIRVFPISSKTSRYVTHGSTANSDSGRNTPFGSASMLGYVFSLNYTNCVAYSNYQRDIITTEYPHYRRILLRRLKTIIFLNSLYPLYRDISHKLMGICAQ